MSIIFDEVVAQIEQPAEAAVNQQNQDLSESEQQTAATNYIEILKHYESRQARLSVE
ncbi:hypothetical protein [Aliikangiella maris]|uniref:Uncharacterized protein n=2 Tax=Aliikangiella maris TaxID=3162458 RepID=A0ABV3MLZ4_9GAMM